MYLLTDEKSGAGDGDIEEKVYADLVLDSLQLDPEGHQLLR